MSVKTDNIAGTYIGRYFTDDLSPALKIGAGKITEDKDKTYR